MGFALIYEALIRQTRGRNAVSRHRLEALGNLRDEVGFGTNSAGFKVEELKVWKFQADVLGGGAESFLSRSERSNVGLLRLTRQQQQPGKPEAETNTDGRFSGST